MRKLWVRRRGVSTMIAGVIVLGLFLTALAAMILVTQQYDAYQGTVNKMKQTDMDRFSENLRFVPPALVKYASNPVSCTAGPCNMYTLIISTLVGNGSLNIGVQIARIYVNSTPTQGFTACTNLCILSPSTNPAPYTFSASQRYINAGEFQHNVTLWFPTSITLPDTSFGLNTVSIATTRGRQFSFNWPLPPLGLPGGGSGGAAGGTGLYIGPLVITFQKGLISYSIAANQISIPIGGTNGYWVVPPPKLILYVKIQTDVGVPNDVYLTAQTVLEMAQFDSPGNVFSFFVVAPITLTYCGLFHTQDPTIICDPSYGYYSGGNQGNPNQLIAYASCSSTPYSSCPNRYMIPRPTPQQVLNNERGNPVVVAFAAKVAEGAQPQPGTGGFSPGTFATSYLGLTYVYNDQTGAGDYTYALTLPFIAICIDNAPSTCSI